MIGQKLSSQFNGCIKSLDKVNKYYCQILQELQQGEQFEEKHLNKLIKKIISSFNQFDQFMRFADTHHVQEIALELYQRAKKAKKLINKSLSSAKTMQEILNNNPNYRECDLAAKDYMMNKYYTAFNQIGINITKAQQKINTLRDQFVLPTIPEGRIL